MPCPVTSASVNATRPSGRSCHPEEITASLVRRLIRAGHVVAGQTRCLSRQQPLLDGARGFELAPYLFHSRASRNAALT